MTQGKSGRGGSHSQGAWTGSWLGKGGVALAALVLVAGCSTGNESSGSPSTTAASFSDPANGPAADFSAPAPSPLPPTELAEVEAASAGGCEALDGARCLLPFPSDAFTVKDPVSETGRRVALPTGQLANLEGTTLDPTEWNRNDGFSPGSAPMALFPDVDLAASGAAEIGRIEDSLELDSPVVLFDLTAGERLAHWVEVDSNEVPGKQLTMIRAAEAFVEGHQIGVAIRGLVAAGGDPIAPSAGFKGYRDNLTTELESFEQRRPEFESLFEQLGGFGIARNDLQLAWSFTVASGVNLSERMLQIRDDAFERLGTAAPTVTVSEVIENDLPRGIGRRVKGELSVPLYLTGAGEPGSKFNNGPDGLPITTGAMFAAPYTCQIPTVALEGEGGQSRGVVYGHGLLGSAGEAENSQVAQNAATNNMVYCAIDWIGMSGADIGNAVSILRNISEFPTLADRVQQGMLNQLFLGRALRHPQGFSAQQAFRTATGASVLVPDEVYFDGNSQGGIIGGATTAVSTEWTKAVLGVPGMNYSLLLSRSVDFDTYLAVLRTAYPDPTDQQIIFGVLQMLWDRAETNGYAQHLTADPYPGTKQHQVLLHVGFGDHQVSSYSAEFLARTIDAKLRWPALASGRHPDARPYFGLDTVEGDGGSESMLVYFDSGTLAPPAGNITPAASPEFVATCSALNKEQLESNVQCADSHEDPRRAPQAIAQKGAFFRPDGTAVDPCDGEPCVAPNRFTLDY